MKSIVFNDVYFTYDKKSGTPATNGLTFEVDGGSVFGLLGPNGSGKTTAVKLLLGLLSPDSGFISIAELDPLRDWRKIRSLIGFVPQETSLYPELTGFQNLEFHCAMYLHTMKGFKDKVNTILKLVDLHHRAREKVSTYSGGMKRRLAIGRALLHDPEIIILDEPTLGVDVQGSHKIWEYIKGLAKKEKTVIVTTNVMSEADFLCDNLLIIDNGTNIAMGTVDELKSSIGKEEIIIRKKPSLDDVFLHYTGKSLRD